jgi:hypothetical protein
MGHVWLHLTSTVRYSSALRNCEMILTTKAWSSACGRPDTATVPTTPTPFTRTGNAPPCGAYSASSSR